MWNGWGDLVGLLDEHEVTLERDEDRRIVARDVEAGRILEPFDDYREQDRQGAVILDIGGRARVNITRPAQTGLATGLFLAPLCLLTLTLMRTQRLRGFTALILATLGGSCTDSTPGMTPASLEMLDWQGSPLMLVSDGHLDRYDPLPFGTASSPIRAVGRQPVRGFVGSVELKNGVLAVGRRPYFPNLGIFGRSDPLMLTQPSARSSSPRQAEVVSYGRSNPAVYTDASGLNSDDMARYYQREMRVASEQSRAAANAIHVRVDVGVGSHSRNASMAGQTSDRYSGQFGPVSVSRSPEDGTAIQIGPGVGGGGVTPTGAVHVTVPLGNPSVGLRVGTDGRFSVDARRELTVGSAKIDARASAGMWDRSVQIEGEVTASVPLQRGSSLEITGSATVNATKVADAGATTFAAFVSRTVELFVRAALPRGGSMIPGM